MESLSPQVVSAAKLPILNPHEFDLWKMRIEQYFLMTDYSLWEVILNGDSPSPTRFIEGVLQPVALTTAEQRLARKNELKARGTLLMALPDKHQLKAHVSAATSVSAVSAKIHVFPLLNVDSLSNAVINSFFASQSSSPQLDNDDLKQIDVDDLKEMDLKWQIAMLTVECFNCHMKGHFTRECRSPKDIRRNGLESVEATLLVYQQNKSVFEEDIKLLNLEVQLRDNALVSLRQNLKKAKQERNDLKLKLDKFQTSSKNLSELLASRTNAKTGLGYNSHIFTRAMFDCDDYLSSGSDESLPPSPIYDRYQSGNRYHVVPPSYTRTFMPPKPDLVFTNTPNDVETDHPAFNIKISLTKPDQDLSHTHRPLVPIIEDWVSDSEDES
nr:ribonuclease H-like domain-containing protein [Tanacetum cinerariifolium]